MQYLKTFCAVCRDSSTQSLTKQFPSLYLVGGGVIIKRVYWSPKSADCVTPNAQLGAFLVARCLRACFARWSLRMKRLRHTVQANLFSPVCVRRWRDSSSERANRLSQPSHLHLKGFSPMRRKKERQGGADMTQDQTRTIILCTTLTLAWK